MSEYHVRVLQTKRTDGVELVDKDDAGRLLARLREKVADAAGAAADKQLDELRGARREERHTGLAGHRFRCTNIAWAG